MQLTQETAQKLFKAMGFSTAGRWGVKNLTSKLNSLSENVDLDEAREAVAEKAEALKAPQLPAILDMIIAALDDEEEIEIGESDPKTKKSKKDKKKKDKKSKKDKKKDKKSKKSKGKGKPAVQRAGGAGVIGSIIEFLGKASEDKPITKNGIVKKLAKRFKDRSAEAMKKTVNVQVPTRLRSDKGLEVQKNEDGYWLEKD